jgi:hypothetical protein
VCERERERERESEREREREREVRREYSRRELEFSCAQEERGVAN